MLNYTGQEQEPSAHLPGQYVISASPCIPEVGAHALAYTPPSIQQI